MKQQPVIFVSIQTMMDKTERKQLELQTLLAMQDGYFETLKELVELNFNNGKDRKAVQLCSAGIEKVISARREPEYILLSLID
jgi:hypothetical protein